MPERPAEATVLTAFRRCVAAVDGPLVLAVSGGCDSMVLLHAAHRVSAGRVAAVATFDHGTGPAAHRAVELVQHEGARLGMEVVAGGGLPVGRTEAAWRDARWGFLRRIAKQRGARVVTAHTSDDQVETVLMRVLRSSGARGLAGLHAESAVVRPFLSVGRGTIRASAAERGIRYLEDPTNDSRRFLRNRIRLDLLPALRTVRPDIDDVLLDISWRAAGVRRGLDDAAREVAEVMTEGGVAVAAPELAGYSRESLAALWPAVAGLAGVALDRRGTERAASFTIRSRVGGRIQLSGGWELHRGRGRFALRRAAAANVGEQRLDGGAPVWLAEWRFARGESRIDDLWTAVLPAGAEVVVRAWRPGDRMVPLGATRPRRVKRFLSDARIIGPERARWPVVVSNGEVVWIPGVRRSEAATARPGRSEVSYECEFNLRR